MLSRPLIGWGKLWQKSLSANILRAAWVRIRQKTRMFYRLSDNVSSLISYLIISLYVQGKAGQWTLPRLDSGLVPDLDERSHSAITDKDTFVLPSLFLSGGAQWVKMSVRLLVTFVLLWQAFLSSTQSSSFQLRSSSCYLGTLTLSSLSTLNIYVILLVDILTDLPKLLRADLPVPVAVEEGECLLQALHLCDADVTVRAGLVCHRVSAWPSPSGQPPSRVTSCNVSRVTSWNVTKVQF